jgi:ATP-dependent DNA helicase RecG
VDRLEIISPGALPNTMTIDKMIAGRRTPRNPIVLEVMRDYGYVDARGMGVRTKVIPLTRQLTGTDPVFEAADDYLKTTLKSRPVPDNVLKKNELPLITDLNEQSVPKNTVKNWLQGQLLSLIKDNPRITYDDLAAQTKHNRKSVQRHMQALKKKGMLRRIGSPKGGHWEVMES